MASRHPLLRRFRGGSRPRLADFLTDIRDVRGRSRSTRALRRAARIPDRPIPTYWFSGRSNFGDALSAVVVAHVSNASPVLVSGRHRGKVLAVGSILHRLAETDTVWGAGAIREASIVPPPRVRFRAVRGPLTRALIRGDVPEVYGDPAMLLPRIYQPSRSKRFELGVIPHYLDADSIRVADPVVSLIDVLSDWQDVVDHINECDTILSSSLHGLIVAEAYGVPAAWFVGSDKVTGHGFKFRDYYESTGRQAPEPVRWGGSLASMTRKMTAPPTIDLDPLVSAWPSELTFSTPE
ncbi:MAG: polysaccharide pyruvyl transferase family protein [Actinomycetota bacterium]